MKKTIKSFLLLSVISVLCCSLTGCFNSEVAEKVKGNSGEQYEDYEEFSESVENPVNYVTPGLKDFLEYSNKKPIILLGVKDYSKGKSADTCCIFVIENKKCKTYNINYLFSMDLTDDFRCNDGNITLGELSKMTNEEILSMLQKKEKEQFDEALNIWSDSFESFNKNAKIFKPSPLKYMISVKSDSTGNNPELETLYLPLSGIGYTDPICSPFIFKSDKDEYFPYIDSLNSGTDAWEYEYTNSYKENYNEIKTGGYKPSFTVYDSEYIKIGSSDKFDCVFRISEPVDDDLTYVSAVAMDGVVVKGIDYVDPTKDDISDISNYYFSEYLKSFKALSSIK